MDRHDLRIALYLAVAASSALLLISQGAITNSDGYEIFQVTRALVERGEISIEQGVAIGRDGLTYSRYGPGLSVLSVVPYLLAKPFAALGSGDLVERAAVASIMPIAGGLLMAALFVLCRRLGAARGASVLVAVGAVAGTYMLPYTKDLFSAPVVTLLVVVAIERAVARRPAQAGAALAIAILIRPVTAAYSPVLLAVLFADRPRGALRAALPILLGFLLVLVWNYLRFGDILEFGYPSHERFGAPSAGHALKLLGHPDKSVILFAPAVLALPPAMLALWRRQRAATVLLAGILAVSFAVAVCWWSGWRGGWSWGPRLMLPGVVAALAVLAPWASGYSRRTRVLVALFATGLAVSASAVLVPTQAQQLDGVSDSPSITRQAELLPSTVSYTAEHTSEGAAAGDHRRFLSLWQVNAVRELGGQGLALAVVLSVVLLGLAIAASVAVARTLREADTPRSRVGLPPREGPRHRRPRLSRRLARAAAAGRRPRGGRASP
jgi:hypothetical protein